MLFPSEVEIILEKYNRNATENNRGRVEPKTSMSKEPGTGLLTTEKLFSQSAKNKLLLEKEYTWKRLEENLGLGSIFFQATVVVALLT